MAKIFHLYTRTRRKDPHTSHEAVATLELRMTKLRRDTLQCFRGRPLLTDLELQALCDNHGSTYRTRRDELVKMGMIEDSNMRVFQTSPRRKNPTKRIVWRITFAGLLALK